MAALNVAQNVKCENSRHFTKPQRHAPHAIRCRARRTLVTGIMNPSSRSAESALCPFVPAAVQEPFHSHCLMTN